VRSYLCVGPISVPSYNLQRSCRDVVDHTVPIGAVYCACRVSSGNHRKTPLANGIDLWVGLDLNQASAGFVSYIPANYKMPVAVAYGFNAGKILVPAEIDLFIREHVALAVDADVINARAVCLDQIAGCRRRKSVAQQDS